jgi:hypothetical protein
MERRLERGVHGPVYLFRMFRTKSFAVRSRSE